MSGPADRRVTIVISDLHVGGGSQDPDDDFIYQDRQFPTLLEKLAATPEAQAGQVELFINGDFLEMAQTAPDVYKLNSSKYWCTEKESLRKLEVIMRGHAEIFEAIAAFQQHGNSVTLVPGNHDPELYFGGVRERILREAPGVTFATGADWFTRYGGRLRISHGHHLDPANRFRHWKNPVLLAEDGQMRLEMCPGTLFMVKFVNWLEKQYPFADNLHPVTKIAGILAREEKFGFVTASWMLARFAARHPADFLSSDPRTGLETGKLLLESMKYDAGFRERLVEIYRRVTGDTAASADAAAQSLATEDALAAFMADAMAAVDMDTWLALFDAAKPETLGSGDDTLAIIRSGNLADDTWRKEAEEQWGKGAQIVVFGHTHIPEKVEQDGKAYYNPGSWTRYVTSSDLAGLRMADLKQEDKFPYQLNYVRVEQGANGELASSMVTFDGRQGYRRD